jgi:hypothetical protein
VLSYDSILSGLSRGPEARIPRSQPPNGLNKQPIGRRAEYCKACERGEHAVGPKAQVRDIHGIAQAMLCTCHFGGDNAHECQAHARA